MNEQDLCDALHDHTSTVPAEPPGWETLVRRAEAARRRSLALKAGAVAAVVALFVGLAAVSEPEGRPRLRAADDPATTSAPRIDVPTSSTATDASLPSTSLAPPVPDWGDCCIWPIAGPEDLAAYERGGIGAWQDPITVARAFATAYLGMREPVVGPAEGAAGQRTVRIWARGEGGGPETAEQLLASGRVHTVVSLRQAGVSRAWTVTAAQGSSITVERPAPGEEVASPVQVAGRARTYEGNVLIEVREDGMTAGESLGEGYATGGGAEPAPFRGSAAFAPAATGGGAVVLLEPSTVDGRPVQATVTRVRFAGR